MKKLGKVFLVVLLVVILVSLFALPILAATLNEQIAASLDDSLTADTGGHYPTETYSMFYYKDANPDFRYGWLRFKVEVPDGSTIDTAYIVFTAYSDQSGSVNGELQHTDEDDAVNFENTPFGRAVSGPAISWTGIPAWTTDTEYNSPELKTLIQDYIDRGGYNVDQYIAIRLSGTGGVASQYRQFYSWDNDPSKAAVLHIEYTPPPADPPTVTTDAADDLEDTTATLNGTVTDDGDETVDYYGFVWDTGADQGDPGDADPGGPPGTWDFGWKSDAGDYGENPFDHGITGLPTGTTIYFRAGAHNVNGWAYGDGASFLTKPATPTNVSATDGVHTDKVVITWTKSTGATDYHVWRGAVDLGAAGDVATFDDVGADAPTITAGTASASDGTVVAHVVLSLAGESANNGTTHTYKVVASNATGSSVDSATDTGYRGVGALTYQWQRSAADSDDDYGNIGGGTTDPYNDTGAPENGDGRYFKCVLDATGAAQQTSSADRGYRGVLPTVTVQAVSDISWYTATGNGDITSVGTGNCNKRGFVWDTDTHADPGNVSPASSGYANSGADTGDFGTGAYTYGLTDLAYDQLYYVRAYVHNNAGYDYSDTEVSFTTESAPPPAQAPTNFTATYVNDYQADLSWTVGVDVSHTLIRMEYGGYPADISDGRQVYYGTGSSYSDDDVDFDMREAKAYYRAWGWSGSGYSTDYAEDNTGGEGMQLIAFMALSLGIVTLAFWQRSFFLQIVGAAVAIAFGVYWINYDPSFIYMIEGMVVTAIGLYMLIMVGVDMFRGR